LNLAEAVVMVPRSDGMPNSLWEAMACGAVPVLADLPQYREVIYHRRNGFLVKPEPQALAEMLLTLLADPQGRAETARRNLALVKDLADQDREMARMDGWYADLAATDAAGPLVQASRS
jgi:glycosyltransferase involved in cell wall biosynthesis